MERRRPIFKFSVFILTAALHTLPASAKDLAIRAVYGSDGRKEIGEVQDPTVRQAARSTVLLMSRHDLVPQRDGSIFLKGENYGESLNLCQSERFYDQTRFGFCSGVLVRPNVILTAGHCIINESDCSKTAILFDVMYANQTSSLPFIGASQVRYCSRIINRSNARSGLDYALIELSQPAEDRVPIRFSMNNQPGHGIFMIGYPWGMPAKYAGDAQIVRQTKLEWVTDLDASFGNSGSPVFSAVNGGLLGILTAGEDGDFKAALKGGRKGGSRNKPSEKSCQLSKACTTSTCSGELVLKIDQIHRAVGQF